MESNRCKMIHNLEGYLLNKLRESTYAMSGHDIFQPAAILAAHVGELSAKQASPLDYWKSFGHFPSHLLL